MQKREQLYQVIQNDMKLEADTSRMEKNGNAPGIDGIPNALLKHLPEGVHQLVPACRQSTSCSS
jgi:hypothetical protein